MAALVVLPILGYHHHITYLPLLSGAIEVTQEQLP